MELIFHKSAGSFSDKIPSTEELLHKLNSFQEQVDQLDGREAKDLADVHEIVNSISSHTS
jgi:predicted house-cleaning noncanonical NTP pyrophosphatase (MazG superfamily)